MWPTPRAGPMLGELTTKDGKPARRNERAYNPKMGKHVQVTLNRAVKMWPTPRSVMWKGCGTSPKAIEQEAKKGYLWGRVAQTTGGGQLNPPWVEWLMGWPIGWTDLRPLEMDRFRLWYEQHGKS